MLETAQDRSRTEQLLSNLRELFQEQEESALFPLVCRQAAQLLRASCAVLYLKDSSGSLRELGGHRRLPGEFRGEKGHCLQAAERAAAACDLVLSFPGPCGQDRLLAVPVADGSSVSGAVVVARDRDAEPFSGEDRDLLREYAADAALGLGNARRRGEAQRATRELQRARNYWQRLMESCADSILGCDAHGTIVFANPRACDHLGGMQGILGQPVHKTYRRGKAEAREIMEILKARGRVQNREVEIVNFAGKVMTVSLSAALLRDERGVIVGTVGFAQDVTEKKLLESRLRTHNEDMEKLVAQRTRALKELEEQYRTIFEKAPIGIMMFDDRGRMTAVNPFHLRTFGRGSAEEYLEKDILQLAAWQSEELVAFLQRVLAGETVQANNFEVRSRLDGRILIVNLLAVPLFDPSGRILRALLFVDDVTESEKMAVRLAQAEKLAAVGRLAAAMAHEINNPLGIIKNYLSLLRQEPAGRPGSDRPLQVIAEEIDRIARIVGSLRPAGDLARGGVPGTCSAAGVLRDLVEMVQPALLLKGIKLETEIPPDLPALALGTDPVKQVCLNLIRNAMDAMAHGGTLRISGRALADRVEIRFQDTGCGIAEENRERLFEPFFTTKEGSRGVGLGLSVSYELMRGCGGDILVSSEEGKGSEFTLLFPLAPGEGAA